MSPERFISEFAILVFELDWEFIKTSRAFKIYGGLNGITFEDVDGRYISVPKVGFEAGPLRGHRKDILPVFY